MPIHPSVLPPGPGPWARIDANAISHNLEWLHRRLHDHCQATGSAPLEKPRTLPRVWAVVKAEAYGHSLPLALPGLQNADGLCVSQLDDILRVRDLGWTRPIMLLSLWGIHGHDLADPALGPLHIVVDDHTQLEELERCRLPDVQAWLRSAGQLRCQGFDALAYTGAYCRLAALSTQGRLGRVGHLHHYAAAEDAAALAHERDAFAQLTSSLPGPHCTGNSAALCGEGPGALQAMGHWLRCGLLLYGASALPGKTGMQLGLRPAMSVHARLLSVRQVRAGETVGYGDNYCAQRDTCVGVVGIGYGHGIPRHLWRQGQILAGDGRHVPLAGRVAMDCLTVDLGPSPADAPGDVFTIWGNSPAGHTLPLENVAHACNTIAAELLTSLTPRVALLGV